MKKNNYKYFNNIKEYFEYLDSNNLELDFLIQGESLEYPIVNINEKLILTRNIIKEILIFSKNMLLKN